MDYLNRTYGIEQTLSDRWREDSVNCKEADPRLMAMARSHLQIGMMLWRRAVMPNHPIPWDIPDVEPPITVASNPRDFDYKPVEDEGTPQSPICRCFPSGDSKTCRRYMETGECEMDHLERLGATPV